MDFSGIKTVQEVCKYIGDFIGEAPTCIETGSAFSLEESNLVHTTTNNILEYICRPNWGTLFSLDINKEHQDITRTMCCGEDCFYVLGDSVENLKTLKEDFGDGILLFSRQVFVDVLWLDSKEFDEDHAVNEYNAIKDRLAEKHFVMVDDIHNPNSVKYKKIVPLLKSLGYSWVEVPTPTGLFVSWVGY